MHTRLPPPGADSANSRLSPPASITTADGQIAVSGLSGNATIQVLSLDGKLLDSTNATDGIATLNAQPGEVVIVKVGTESYKVVVR